MKRTPRKTKIGGQALLEGLVMKGPEKTCLAIRKPNGEIYKEVTSTKKNPTRKIPIVRGAYAMVMSLAEGYNSIMKSADIAFPEGSEEEDKFDKWLQEKLGDKAGKTMGLIAGVLGALLAIVLFMVIPTLITGLINRFVELGSFKAVVEGVLKIGIFILYLFLVTRMKEIHRVFEYHGAEHKTINCYENYGVMTVEGVREHSRFHPRCGTSFLFIVLIVSILVFSFVPWGSTWLRTLLKLAALPLVMGVSYEILMFAGSHDNWFCRVLAAPGKWVQRLTTFEPDDGQIEVAIVAFTAVEPDAIPPCKEDEVLPVPEQGTVMSPTKETCEPPKPVQDTAPLSGQAGETSEPVQGAGSDQ